uniref:Uncharacterized protein n=1 Tax=viral metagenome TaxID=1070528 RepID=A0A6C0KN22_9ZZZZ
MGKIRNKIEHICMEDIDTSVHIMDTIEVKRTPSCLGYSIVTNYTIVIQSPSDFDRIKDIIAKSGTNYELKYTNTKDHPVYTITIHTFVYNDIVYTSLIALLCFLYWMTM